jgi:hypothetical protein
MMKRLDRRVLIRIVLLTGALASPASGAQAGLTSRDSAEIWVGVIRVLLDTLYSGRTAIPVLWVAPPRTLDSVTSQIRHGRFSPAVRSAIEAALPAAQPVDSLDSAFLCEPGSRLGLPSRGCAIRDSGLAVLLGHFRLAGDTIRTFGTLMRSRMGSSGPTASGSAFTELVFVRRAPGGWQLVAAGGRIVS